MLTMLEWELFYNTEQGVYSSVAGPTNSDDILVPPRPADPSTYDPETNSWVVHPIEPQTVEEMRASLQPLPKKYLRKTLLLNGIALSRVRDVIDAIPDEIERDLATVEWDDSETYQRLHPLLVKVAHALGLTDLQMDSMWKQGLQLMQEES